MIRRALVLTAALAALAAPGAVRAAWPDAWHWTLEAAPSVFSPRMHGMDNALAYEGLNVLDRAWRDSGASAGAKVPTDFAKIEWGFGGQISVAYEFNEDLRGGVFLGMNGVWKQDYRIGVVDTSTAIFQITATVTGTVTSSTTYRVDEKVSLPLLTIGVFLHKVFRYEEEPNLRTYLGGWGAYGSLIGATISGSFTRAGTDPPVSFSTDLTAKGWSAGGMAGVEYAVARTVSIFGETGYNWCIIPKVQWLGNQGGAGRLATSANKPISLDYTGIYIRAGVKVALAGPS
ncbi:MAG: hypothetical protein AAB152_14280 [Candidatus Coatesbacteria bacterium]